MKKIVETERLILREFMPSDAESMFDLNADPDVLRYTGNAPFASVYEAEQFLNNYTSYKESGYGRWAVISQRSGAFLGWCGLKFNEEQLVDIGFRFFKKEWNKGYATEAARATIKYGFTDLKLQEIIGRATIENKASICVLKKIGMKFWKFGPCEGMENTAYYRVKKACERVQG